MVYNIEEKMKKNIGIIGAGSWGTAVAQLIAKNNYNVNIYSRDEVQIEKINKNNINEKFYPEIKLSKRVKASSNLKKIVETSDILFIAIPSKEFRKVMKKISSFIRPDQIIISLSKGIEIKTYSVMSKIISQESSAKLIGVLSGPNLAIEVMKGYPAATVIASKFDYVIKTVSKVISSEKIMVFAQRDVVGVELAGALKNVVAIASGIGSGLGLGVNTKSFLVTLGISEIKHLAIELGAEENTFSGLAGIGDLMANSFSGLSRNFKFGELVGLYGAEEAIDLIGEVVEGHVVTKVAHIFAKSVNINAPILEGVYQILYKKKDINEVLKGLLKTRGDFIWE